MGTFQAALDERVNKVKLPEKFGSIILALRALDDGSEEEFIAALKEPSFSASVIVEVVKNLTGVTIHRTTIDGWRRSSMWENV